MTNLSEQGKIAGKQMAGWFVIKPEPQNVRARCLCGLDIHPQFFLRRFS